MDRSSTVRGRSSPSRSRFISSFRPLACSFWPYMIPFALTVEQAAAKREPHIHVLGARLFVIPLTLIYTIVVYRVFHGRVAAVGYEYCILPMLSAIMATSQVESGMDVPASDKEIQSMSDALSRGQEKSTSSATRTPSIIVGIVAAVAVLSMYSF
jgi:hypothetical protein